MKIKTTPAQIQDEIAGMHRGGAAAECYYASMLRMVLAPSTFDLEEESIRAIVNALRAHVANSASLKTQVLLAKISPLNY